MPEVIVTDDDPLDEHEREMGRTEGVAEVHAEHAAEHAGNAEQAAEVAAGAAAVNMELAGEVGEVGERAEAAAGDAADSRDAVLAALSAQTDAMNSLVEELRLARENAAQAPEPTPVTETKPTRTPDKAPAVKPTFRDRYNKRGR